MEIMESKRGKPLKWKTAKELQDVIDGYFAIVPFEEWTITGLALALQTTRKTLLEYQYDESDMDYVNAIIIAKQRIENSYEIDLKKYGRTGTIFALKNFDWKDKQEVDNTNSFKFAFSDNPQIASENIKRLLSGS